MQDLTKILVMKKNVSGQKIGIEQHGFIKTVEKVD
jgi:hypothetical protein